MAAHSDNPLCKRYETPFESVPFELIQAAHFLPGLDFAIEQARLNIKSICENPKAPNFENTIVALEVSSTELDAISSVYSNLHSLNCTDELQALAQPISLKVTEFSSEIALNQSLFSRVKEVHNSLPKLTLTNEQTQLVEKTFKSFSRNGALLSSSDKDKLRQIDNELAMLTPQFSENLLKTKQEYSLPVAVKDLVGLPESLQNAMRIKSPDGGPDKFAVTFDEPLFVPFMQFCQNRELRKQLWKDSGSRCYKTKLDNSEIVKKMARLRFDRARLLGFENHAFYVLEERMAQRPDKVMMFLDRLLSIARPACDKEMATLRDYAKSKEGGHPFDLMPWDFSFYFEKLKKEKFQLDPEKLKEYFELESVLKGLFSLTQRLYGLEFRKTDSVSKYHPDAKVFEVFDSNKKMHIGLLYVDLFPRPEKKGGAWMGCLREQGLADGKILRPHVMIAGNFTKATPDKPALMRFGEVETLFHEFGHALHGLLSECTYRSVAGTNVYWDFVELPSQFMENWTLEKEVLDLIAKHYVDGSPLPEEWVALLKAESKFMAGYFNIRQLSFAFLDMAWHAKDPSSVDDIEVFESRELEKTRLFERVPGTCTSTAFGHIFAGGYSAGYYSYKWAEVLDADAFEFFKEKGLFNKDIALRFRQDILSKGATEHPMTLYKKFRGREPDPDSLLRRDGLLK